ncbi:MAG: sulfite exporter TauE/SafE family protein [Clostridia bacterium]|nr:sulfite exporter TauE/SafE family protein [Clostridia bacterium]
MLIAIVAFLVSILMGIGVGGGGLFIIFLTECMNFSQIVAQGTNLVFFVLAGASALILHIRKRKLNIWQILIMSSLGILGSLIFSHLANILDPSIPRKALGVLLVLSGIITIFSLFKEKNLRK